MAIGAKIGADVPFLFLEIPLWLPESAINSSTYAICLL